MFGENYIQVETAQHLAGLFRERVNLTPNVPAYKEFDSASEVWQVSTWHEMSQSVVLWQQMMLGLGLKRGDHVAIMAGNGRNWVLFDQAALGLGLVTVPLYAEDRADNVAYIIDDADVKLVFVQGQEQWQALIDCDESMPSLQHIISIEAPTDTDLAKDKRMLSLPVLLATTDSKAQLITENLEPDTMASIVYTSGTTGRPKGVMLSHKNILSNAWGGLQCAAVDEESVFLSFLPLSHMLERSAGYYMAMMAGSCVAYTRGIPVLGEDLLEIKPTVLISVPRIYEKVFAKIQAGLQQKSGFAQYLFHKAVDIGWRRFEYKQARQPWFLGLLLWPVLNTLVAKKIMARLGGRMEIAISGGAPLPPEIAKVFIALGLPLLQGYGLTETSPVLTVNREAANIPHSIGQALPNVRLRIDEQNSELQAQGDSVMLGYWKNSEATQKTFTSDNWIKTGDCASVDELGHYYITGRLKDILVLGNGEKVPPADMEMAMVLEPLFENVMVIGEGRSHLTAIVTLEEEQWQRYAAKHNFSLNDLQSDKLKEKVQAKISRQLESFPGYAVIRDVLILNDHWTVENDMITTTMKVKRPKVLEKYDAEIDAMYERILNRHKSHN